jgi:type VI secretion system protein ImpK
MNSMSSDDVFSGDFLPRLQDDLLNSRPLIKQQGRTPRTLMHKAGQQYARWQNPFISHAMPSLLSVQRFSKEGALNQAAVRLLLVQELRLFRERLTQAKLPPEQVQEASYLLCTYIDEAVSDLARSLQQTPYLDEPSLLVEFHGDAWGGEDAFASLEHWMRHEQPPIPLLAFYELLLGLGWQGRYRIRERGEVLLLDLRSQLHALVWKGQIIPALGSELIRPERPQKPGWSFLKKIISAALLILVVYGLLNLVLDFMGRPVRAELAAWEPPVRTINLAERLPSPLPDLLSEGWLTADKHPQGWLLVFKSDGAFDLGKSEFKPKFHNNIERLAKAFAPWPGDLEVIGHTDIQPIKSSQFPSNYELSKARAETAAQILRRFASHGFANGQSNGAQRVITSTGRGDMEPIDKSNSVVAFERNRRVDVLWKVIP